MQDQTVCRRCVMDTSARDIAFDLDGNCNYCSEYLAHLGALGNQSKGSDATLDGLESLADAVKKGGKGKAYDCIVGVSGGVDSSWALVKAVELGLRPLAVHMDNGWNSNLAVSNISNLVDGLGVDLFTYVINWKEYRSLMDAFFDADVIDVELLYDNALHEVCYSQARKYGVRYILSGSNFSTEGMRMPASWAWGNKWDGRNILKIAKRSKVEIKTFPLFSTLKWLCYSYGHRIQWVPFLDYVPYNKEEVLTCLESEYSYTRYPYKHYESVFTRFYQGHILPKKFGVDKRRVHFSSLIASGQLDRSLAIENLSKLPYPSDRDLEIDMKFFLSKMEWATKDLKEYLGRPEVSHGKYGTDLIQKIVFPVLRRIRLLYQSKHSAKT
jgi:N-acetyl sugar amidotransferase